MQGPSVKMRLFAVDKSVEKWALSLEFYSFEAVLHIVPCRFTLRP